MGRNGLIAGYYGYKGIDTDELGRVKGRAGDPVQGELLEVGDGSGNRDDQPLTPAGGRTVRTRMEWGEVGMGILTVGTVAHRHND